MFMKLKKKALFFFWIYTMDKPNWTPFCVIMGFQVGGMVNMQCIIMHQLNIKAKNILLSEILDTF
jgi:hypothetical protein